MRMTPMWRNRTRSPCLRPCSRRASQPSQRRRLRRLQLPTRGMPAAVTAPQSLQRGTPSGDMMTRMLRKPEYAPPAWQSERRRQPAMLAEDRRFGVLPKVLVIHPGRPQALLCPDCRSPLLFPFSKWFVV